MSVVTPSVSIVIPIYNVEDYLNNCINAILTQHFSDFEMILVNDGSTDKSGIMCDEYAKQDNRIKVLHKINGGLSSARNAGINIAKGKYIVFIDPDDQISNDYFLKLYDLSEQNNCDIVVGGYCTVPSNSAYIPSFKLNEITNGKELILSSRKVHSDNNLCFVWRYFYRLEKIKNIRFNERVFYGEDVIFNLEVLLQSDRVLAIPDILYFYTVNNPNSLMRKPYKPKLESSLVLQYKIRRYLSEKHHLLSNKNYRHDMANYYINNIYRLLLDNLKHSENLDVNMAIKRLVNYEMISKSVNDVMLSNSTKKFKEFIYLLALKYRLYPLLVGVFKREVNRT